MGFPMNIAKIGWEPSVAKLVMHVASPASNGTFVQPDEDIPDDDAYWQEPSEEIMRASEVTRQTEAILAKYLKIEANVSFEVDRDDIFLVIKVLDTAKPTAEETEVLKEFLYDRWVGLLEDDPLLDDVNRIMGR